MLGFLPVTFLIFIYVFFFSLAARGSSHKEEVGELFFANHETIFLCVLVVVYIVSAIFGYFKGWEGYTKAFSFLDKWLDNTGGIEVDSGAKVLTPKDRVRKMHNKARQ